MFPVTPLEDGGQLALRGPFTSLLTVKIVIPVERDSAATYAGLKNLGSLLIVPIAKPNVQYSLYLHCSWHADEARYHTLATDSCEAELLKNILTLVRTKPGIDGCPVFRREVVKKAVLVGISYASSRFLEEVGLPVYTGAHRDTINLRKLLIGMWDTCSRLLTVMPSGVAERYGYKGEDITTLIDFDDEPLEAWPTRENIVSSLPQPHDELC